ncbi:acetyltransferase (isoleucine patch superfamily) [Solitalea canadensis DSM 3403]|uniref:Acetyltransferase (Isoleucine patch superfamily) n=1 Tax=Solitalea canadensis (strain ATCC 29591 / DSM 3403 / JCM 21819 / LMG 8368 / NBRC 15130 / NCIMB 12057 / USAM 9D) TaxID=929556 RepID=H8KSA4_SOLCM|nr:acetyltransferase (isoleucine patch superfamily) [Solitalea canadensis DSM 3403]
MEPNIDLSKYKNHFSLKNKVARCIWNISYLLLFKPFFLNFFNKWRILLLKIFGAKIMWSTNVYSSAKIWAPWNLEMGEYACLGPYVDCYNQGKIKIGANTTISQKAYLCASSHDISDPSNPLILKPITIEDQAWIAADSFIGPGVFIRQGAVVGARSAVFKNVDAWTVVGGNPAVFIKKRELKSF